MFYVDEIFIFFIEPSRFFDYFVNDDIYYSKYFFLSSFPYFLSSFRHFLSSIRILCTPLCPGFCCVLKLLAFKVLLLCEKN